MTDDKKTDKQPEQAEPTPAPTVIVRTLVLQTDGNKLMIPRNEFGLLELAHALQMLTAYVEREINQAAQPAPPDSTPDPVPDVPPEQPAEEQSDV